MAGENTNQNFDTDDLPQVVTESYGTGVKDAPGYNIGDRADRYNSSGNVEASPEITGGDIDALWQQEATVGDEAVGGTVPTPDQDIVDEMAAGVGLELDDNEEIQITNMLEERDDSRWELDPLSSEDYGNRTVEGQEGDIGRPDSVREDDLHISRSLSDPATFRQEMPYADNEV
ncbi:hypothetical protein NUACC21_43200 [Scytonema sp. NUACC21]